MTSLLAIVAFPIYVDMLPMINWIITPFCTAIRKAGLFATRAETLEWESDGRSITVKGTWSQGLTYPCRNMHLFTFPCPLVAPSNRLLFVSQQDKISNAGGIE